MTTEAKSKPYRVTLRVTSLIDLGIEASSMEEARAKAFEWCPESEGDLLNFGYWLEDTFIDKEEQVHWELIDVEGREIVGVEKLKPEVLS